MRHKDSSITRKIFWYSVSAVIINLVFSLISTMILMIKATGVDIIEKLDPHVRDGLKFFSFIILYSPIQPLFVITICNIINMLQAIILEKKYSAYSYTNSKLYKKQGRFNLGEERHNMDEDANFSTVLQHKNLLVLNPYILPNLGCVEDVFFDKTGTLALTRFEVQSFATAKKHYKSSTENFRIGGITNVKADNFNEDGNDSERSFEGFDSMMFLDNNKTRDADDDFQVYDFGARKMLPNPFNEGKLNSSLQSQNDLAALENPTEDKTTLNNEKFLQTSNPVRRADRRFSFVQGAAQKLMDDLEKPYDEVEFMTDTKTDKDLKYILQMFTVCHNAKVKGDEYQTHSAEERCLLKFAEQFNYACLSAIPNTGYETDEDIHQKVYEVKRQDGVAQKYYVYIINEGKTKNDRFSILAQDTSSRTFWMFVKGSTECMENLIDFGSSTNNYKKAIKFNKESGLHSIVFARKQITEADVLKTVADYKKIIQTSLDVETDLSTLMGKLESNLKFSAVVGVKTSMREDAAATVDLMKSMGLNVHILTGDSFENAVNTATYLKLLPLSDQQPYTVLDFEDVSDGNVKIREVLDKMKVVMSNKKRTGGTELDLEKVNRDVPAGLRRSTTQVESSNFFSHSFVFSGRTIEVITSSKYLYTHFAFILQFASSIVGYDMKPMHKGYLINLMKEAHRSKIIMTVGDGFNDIPMMYNSDISVQITTENTQLGYGDIVTKDLAIIPEIMLLEGVKFNSNLNLSVMGSFFNSILVACILFFFQFYCAFTSTAIIQSGLIYATYAAYSALALIFIIYESVYPELLRCELPALYIESYYFNKMKLSKFMVLFLGAMISAVVIFYPAMYYMTTEITPSGIPMNSNNFTLHLIMCSHFATVLRFMFITRRGMFMIVAVAIDIAAFALVWVGIIFVNVNNSIYEVAILELLENMNSLIGFFASIMVSFIIDWALWETYHLSRLFPIFIYMKINSRKKISIDSSRALNKQLLTSFHSHPELSRTVRNCFGINDEIDLVIESILGKSSNREVEISSKTLSIESSKLRKKYGIYIVKKFLTNLRVQFGIGFLCILIFSIITAVIQRKIDQIFFVNFGITVCVFSIFMITISRAFEVNLEQFAWLITPSFAVIGAFNSLVREADHSLLSVVIVIFTITNYSIDFRMVSLMILLQFIWYCFSYLLIYDKLGSYMWTFDMDNKQAQVYAIASLVCTVFLIKITAIVQRYRIEKLIKREFIAGSVLQSKSNLTTDLLKLLLPTFVLDQMKSFDIQDKTIGDDAGEVTILFCDIADFDKVIKLKEKDIVKILDNIFRRFDELCKENGCQKIETVGKTYMACGGLKYVEQTISKELRDINPTARILDLAKQMMFEIKNYEDLTLKIGIHRGKCMMGVIGYHKPQFSLIGDVVNTTSRHCTTGEKGHIMVSHDAWGQLTQTNVKSKGYTFLEVETEMKGKGLVPVYHLMPFQGLVRKKLEEIIERYKREKKPMPEALKKIEQVLSNSRHELRRKMINSKINLLLRNVIENAKKEMKQDLLEESQMAEVNQIPARGQNRKKTIGAGAARTSKRMSTKLNIQNNARQVEPFENVESSDSEEDEDAGEYAMLKPTPMLQFKSNQFFLMKKYRQKLKEINTSTLRIFFGLMAIHYIVQIVLHITKKSGLIFTDDHPLVFPLKIDSNDEQKKFAFSFAMVLISAALSISMMLVPSFFYSRMGKLFYFSFYIFMSISSMLRLYILHGYTRLYHSHIIILELVLQYNCSIQCAVLDFVESATLFFVQLTFFLVFSILKYLSVTTSGSYLFDYIVFYLVIGIYAIFNNYHYIKTEISWYNTEGQTSKKKEMIQDFILRLIPKHLSSKIGSPELSIGDTYENVTLLFADIVGFTSYSAGKTPNEVVHMLSRLFTSFDKECNKLELYKVYTIGDCYVVMSFLDGNQRIKPEEECADVVELGFSMIEIIARVRKEVNFDGLHMRIGIHTGNIIGGIVGTDIVRFDLYGADVLIANKMESNGQQDRIHISQSSKDLLEKVNFNGRYIFTPSTPTEVKALGAQIPSYFVDKDIKNELDLSPQSK